MASILISKELEMKVLEHHSNVYHIQIQDFDLTNLSDWITTLKSVKVIDIERCTGRIVNDFIYELDSLERIGIVECDVENLNLDFKRFKNLKILIINRCDLDKIPEFIYDLDHIKELDISENLFRCLPKELEKMSQLENLSCAEGFLSKIDGLPMNITSLDLSKNMFQTFPLKATELKKIEELDITENYISQLPDEFYEMKSLKILHSNMNSIKSISPKIKTMENLEELAFSENKTKIEGIHHIASLPNMIKLFLSYNDLKIEDISFISSMKKLYRLDLSYNNLGEFPRVILDFENLHDIHLSGINMTEIPYEIEKMKKLRIVNIAHNEITGPRDVFKNNKFYEVILSESSKRLFSFGHHCRVYVDKNYHVIPEKRKIVE
jgi:Leucine-rich repeat (LRR) protein